jgi:hypothetical protein
MTLLRGLDELRVDARYHRERRDLYRAKVYGQRPTSPTRLRELEQACAFSELRLRRAERRHEEETARQRARNEQSE